MKQLVRKNATSKIIFSAGITLAIILFAIMFSIFHKPVDAATGSGRLVTIHDRGEEKVMLSDAATIGDALADAGVTLDSHDAVEPAVTEKLVATEYQINIYRARPVTVIDGPTRTKIVTAYQTAEQIVTDSGITLYSEDTTRLSRSDDILADGAGLQLTIDRATPFSFTLYGATTQARTQATTIGDMLKEKKIVLGENDRVSVATETPIAAGMEVRVWREGKQTVTVDEEIAFTTESIKDADQEIGYKAIRTNGEKGTRSVTYEVVIQDGKEVGRTEIASVTTKESVKQVEVIGAKLSNSFSGSFAEALGRLRACESGGNYANKKNPKYRGAYQYDYSTWANYAGFYDPADAPANVQDEKAWETYQRRGWQPWPSCKVSQGLQDIYR